MAARNAMRIINHGPGPVRLVRDQRRGELHKPALLLEAGQAMDCDEPVSVMAVFGSTHVEMLPPITRDPCESHDPDDCVLARCDKCHGTGRQPVPRAA